MLQQRRQAILDYIKCNGEIRLSNLKIQYPEVSEMTLRRDLDYLAEQHLILRTHGGAKAFIPEPVKIEQNYIFSKRLTENPEAKAEVARLALPFISEGMSIYLDAGSTMLSFARLLPDIPFYIFTNAPNIAIELASRNHPEIVLLGGKLKKSTISLTGPFAMDCLDKVNIDIAFIATSGFSSESGFTNAYINECELKRKVMQRAKKVIVLMDHTKINRSLPYTFADTEDVDVIITDRPMDPALASILSDKEILVITG
jgi:DeoR/GlpR family transcriptional regulator of sugar metabolism